MSETNLAVTDHAALAARIAAFLDSQTPPIKFPEGRAWLQEGKELCAIVPDVFLQALKTGMIGARINAQLALRENGYEVWDVDDDPIHTIYSVKTPDGEEYMIEPEQQDTEWPSIVSRPVPQATDVPDTELGGSEKR